MRWLAAVMAAVVMTGCYRTVYVPTESEYASKERERVLSTVADTVIVAERCTVRIMPEGTSSVVQRTGGAASADDARYGECFANRYRESRAAAAISIAGQDA